jgi:hypothetical protein
MEIPYYEKAKMRLTSKQRTANIGFSAMLADEYILIFLSLSAVVRAERINLNKRI